VSSSWNRGAVDYAFRIFGSALPAHLSASTRRPPSSDRLLQERSSEQTLRFHRLKANPPPLPPLVSKGGDAVMPHLVTILAGAAAESALNPGVRISDGAQSDREEAFGIAVAAVCNVPDSNVVSPDEMARTKSEREALLKSADAATDRFVALHVKVIQRVASLLRQQEELTGEHVAEIVRSMAHPGDSVGNP
jgi:hypothetical protein